MVFAVRAVLAVRALGIHIHHKELCNNSISRLQPRQETRKVSSRPVRKLIYAHSCDLLRLSAVSMRSDSRVLALSHFGHKSNLAASSFVHPDLPWRNPPLTLTHILPSDHALLTLRLRRHHHHPTILAAAVTFAPLGCPTIFVPVTFSDRPPTRADGDFSSSICRRGYSLAYASTTSSARGKAPSSNYSPSRVWSRSWNRC